MILFDNFTSMTPDVSILKVRSVKTNVSHKKERDMKNDIITWM